MEIVRILIKIFKVHGGHQNEENKRISYNDYNADWICVV